MLSVAMCSPSMEDGWDAMEGDRIIGLDLKEDTEEGLPSDEFLE